MKLQSDRFLKYLQYEKRYSGHTLAAYRKDLDQFIAFVAAEYGAERPGDVTYFFVRSWVVSLMEAGRTPRTVNRKISSLKSFFRFLLREKKINTNPMQRVVAPKVPKNLPGFVRKEGMETLLGADAFGEGFDGLRDRVIVELLYGTGMRRAELCGLQEDAVNLADESVKVLGKRNKERIIPLSPALARLLRRYVEARGKQPPPETGPGYLLHDKGRPIPPGKVYRLVKKYLGLVATNEKKSPHLLRHTFATHMLDNGADINAIKELLGHASLAATQVYTHNSIEKIKQVYRQAHPKA